MSKSLLKFIKESKNQRIAAIAKLALETDRSLLEAVEYYNELEVKRYVPVLLSSKS